MKLGVCCSLKDAALVKQIGYDYFECTFCSVAEMSDEEFEAFRTEVHQLGFFPEAMNVMLPGTMRLTGDHADHEAIRPYLETGFRRAAQVKMKSVVFGSGDARNLPKGFTDRAKGYDQIVDYTRMAGEIAARYGCVIAVEPLSFPYANIVNFIAEGVYVAQRVNMPESVRSLADYYHMLLNKEPLSMLYAHGAYLQHCHISAPTREFPAPQDRHNYEPFFAALKAVGFRGRLSIEANAQGPLEQVAKAAFDHLKPLI